MSKGNVIKIGMIEFRIVNRIGQRILVSWNETGVEKTRWIIWKGL